MSENQSVILGSGNLGGKGVYAAREFKKGEVVIEYHLTPLSEIEYKALPESEKQFTHVYHGVIRLYGEPERYVNHSGKPNTIQDLERGCDVALRDIAEGEAITTDSAKDDVS